MYEESRQYVKDCMKDVSVDQFLELDAPSRSAIGTGRVRQIPRNTSLVWACYSFEVGDVARALARY